MYAEHPGVGIVKGDHQRRAQQQRTAFGRPKPQQRRMQQQTLGACRQQKREKQQLAQAIRELVALAEKRQQKRQEAIDRFLTAYSAYLAKQGGAERRTP